MKPRIVLLVAVPLAILLLPVVVYLVDAQATGGEIPRNVSIDGVPVGGLGREDAILTLQAHEFRLATEPAVFVVESTKYRLDPTSVEFGVDEETAVDQAFQQRTSGGALTRFWSWIGGFSETIDIPLEASMDEQALDEQFSLWEVDAIPNPAFEGGVTVVGTEVVAEPPRTGRALQRAEASRVVLEVLSMLDRPETDLPVAASSPALTSADVEAAAAEARAMIAKPVTLRSTTTGFLITFSTTELAAALTVETLASPTRMVSSFDGATIGGILEPRRPEFETEPVDAAYNVDLETNVVSVIPSRTGTLLDLPAVVASLEDAARGPGFGDFPVREGAAPAFTTGDAESFGDLGLVSEFTTKHPCCEARLTNIQLMADIVDGAFVEPGAKFSINDFVGQRTEAKGFVAAPAIIGGIPSCCDHPANIGGGVSQFGTTFYNTVFFGCFEDVEHTPHSLYFSRYPEGREATLGFPKPDVIFLNNTEAPVIIKTQHTNNSITVKFFGNNGGRECIAETSERANLTDFEEELVADKEDVVRPGERVKERSGIRGFTVAVTRIIRLPDGSVLQEEPFRWRYRTLSQQHVVHPCEVSGGPIDCPIQLQSVVGVTYDDAFTLLAGQGFQLFRTDETVSDPDLHGIVLATSPEAGEWLPIGSNVTLTVGLYEGGGEEEA